MADPSETNGFPQNPGLGFEQALWSGGMKWVAGIDEAGRGPIAGPVCAGVVILPPSPAIQDALSGVRDSKQMSPDERLRWAGEIEKAALAHSIAFASPGEIDTLGIVSATHLAVRRALESLPLEPDYLLMDYLLIDDLPFSQTSLIKGDCLSLSIAAASVLAKTTRDLHLCELDRYYAGYGLASHKGYATPKHLAALARLGPCEIHRFSFSPVKELIAAQQAL